MKKIEFKAEISSTPEHVWKTMLDPDTYREWISAGWPGSTYEGEWKEGEKLIFSGPGGGGTQVEILKLKPYEIVDTEHIAVVNKDGSLDTSSELAQGWIGSKETYRFNSHPQGTELIVEIVTTPAWEDMVQEGWPDALQKLKEIAETA